VSSHGVSIRYCGFCALVVFLLSASPSPGAEALRDPTRPPQGIAAREPGAETANWRVTAILISPQRRVATVNGKAVQIGDRVSGARVVEIAPGAVRLRDSRKEFTVRLQTQRIKEPAAPSGEGNGIK